MLSIIPIGEELHPSLRGILGGNPLARPVRAISAGSEQRLRERIVIADAWPAVGGGDAHFFHGYFIKV